MNIADTGSVKMLSHADVLHLWTYDPITGVFRWRIKPSKSIETGAITGSRDADGYLQLCYQGKRYKAHRVATIYMTGKWPEYEIDHKNRVRSDNRWNNLRPATRKQNGENQSIARTNTSGVRGVSWYPKYRKWVAYIKHCGKKKTLGYFFNIEDAAKARAKAEAELFTYA
jgi:hypothetical protein